MNKNPIIMISTDNAPVYCRSNCGNGECTKHQSRGFQHMGVCKFSLLRGTEECEGFKSIREKKKHV